MHGHCIACGKRRSKQKLLYEPTSLIPFCKDTFGCNRQNLNHIEQIILRKREIVPMDPMKLQCGFIAGKNSIEKTTFFFKKICKENICLVTDCRQI
ncbi:hypothetical protein SAMN04488601_10477 [Paenibacillus sp. 453mf]|nr:hypothetical protein SAMN04488601_10477 [Paenibacillus sp. 453mf]